MTEHIHKIDPKDRLLAALFAQLKAERETREALAWAIRSGVTSPEVLEALAGDPVPVAVAEDVTALERIFAIDDASSKH
jgi:hypothetical protein